MDGSDDRRVIARISREAGTAMTLTGRASEGTSGGAIYVDLEDGRPAVVTRFLGSVERARQTASVLARASSDGLPVPLPSAVVAVGTQVFLVQQRMSGSPPTAVTPQVMDAVVAVNDVFADILIDHPSVPVLPLCLSRSGDPHPRHEVLAQHSRRSRRVLEAIRDVGRHHPGEMTGHDLLHIDLDLSNVLVDEAGIVTAVVDWNLGAYRGDRHLALIKTRFEQEWALHEPLVDPMVVSAARHLDQLIEQRVTSSDRQRYWAHRLLYQLHWILQSGYDDVIDWHLDVAEDRLC